MAACVEEGRTSRGPRSAHGSEQEETFGSRTRRRRAWTACAGVAVSQSSPPYTPFPALLMFMCVCRASQTPPLHVVVRHSLNPASFERSQASKKTAAGLCSAVGVPPGYRLLAAVCRRQHARTPRTLACLAARAPCMFFSSPLL